MLNAFPLRSEWDKDNCFHYFYYIVLEALAGTMRQWQQKLKGVRIGKEKN